MLRSLLCFATLFLLPALIAAQNCPPERFRELMRDADRAAKNGQYDLAINKLQSAKTCRPDSASIVEAKIITVFLEVNKQRELAIKNGLEATLQRDLAQKNEKLANVQRDSTEQQRQLALQNEKEAIRQRDAAEAARKAALEGQKKAEKSARANRLAAFSLQAFRNDRYELAWHTSALAYYTSLDTATGGSIEPGVCSILNSIISDSAKWSYQNLPDTELVDFSEPAGHLLTLIGDSSAQIWDLHGNRIARISHPDKSSLKFAAYSPMGSRIISFSKEEVFLWDSIGNFITKLEGNYESAISFSFDYENIVKFSKDGQLYFFNGKTWDKNGTLVCKYDFPEGFVAEHCAFSEDNQYLAVINFEKLLICNTAGKILSIENLKYRSQQSEIIVTSDKILLFLVACSLDPYTCWTTLEIRDFKGVLEKSIMLKEEQIMENIISPDKKSVLVQLDEVAGSRLHWYLWKLDGSGLEPIKNLESPHSRAFYAPDGERIITLEFNQINLLNKSGEQLRRLKHNSGDNATEAVFSHDSKFVVTYSKESKTADYYLWDAAGKPLQMVKLPVKMYNPYVAFHPVLQYVLIADQYHVFYWFQDGRLEQAKMINSIKIENPGFRVLQAFFYLKKKDPILLISRKSLGNDIISPVGNLTLWRKNGYTPLRSNKVQPELYDASYSKKGDFFIVSNALYGGHAYLMDKNARMLSEIKPPLKTMDGFWKGAVFSPSEPLILGYFPKDEKAFTWDFSGKIISTFNHISGSYSTEAVFSPDGQRILTSGANKGEVFLWSKHGKLQHTLAAHTERVQHLAFSNNSLHILTCSSDKTARIWDTTGTMIRSLEHETGVSFAVFSPDGKHVFTTCENNKIYRWTTSGQLLHSWEYGENPEISVAPNGRFLAAIVSNSELIYLIDTSGQKLVLEGHSKVVNKVAFSPDSKYLLSTSPDQTVRIWDINGNLLTSLEFKEIVTSASFSPDGKNILTALLDGTIYVWESLTEYINNQWRFTDEDLIRSGVRVDEVTKQLIWKLIQN